VKRKPINLKNIALYNSKIIHKYKLQIPFTGNIIFESNALDANTIINYFYSDNPDLKFYILKRGKYVKAEYSNR
jgi:hypothetical protein